jgi:hypothetical protein
MTPTTPTGMTPTTPMGMTPTTPIDTGMAGSGSLPMEPPTMPMEPAPVQTGISVDPIEFTDPDITCHEFRAGEFVGVANDSYREKVFDAPWTGTVYAKSFRSLIDNAQVTHHWLFYKGAAGARSLVVGWAPGGSDTYFSDDLGMELPDQAYSIQYHYNSNDPGAMDNSGVEVCVTPNKPANVATVSWLGTDAIFGASATGTCDPITNERIHILAATPHMHKKGINAKVVVNRAGGAPEVVHDMPFDFAYQQQYIHDLWIEPGDTITTTCTYSAPSTFGPGTDAEMCYWFAVHYPANGLVDAGLIGKGIHGPNSCLGM